MSGLYIHIPFCHRKCGYCDFYSSEKLDLMLRFLDALTIEMDQYSRPNTNMTFDTVYMGGGTPSLLSPQQIYELMNTVSRYFKLSGDPECTIEMNPGTVTHLNLDACIQSGFNRLSLGAQSFSGSELQLLERSHHPEDILSAFEMAQSIGFKNISLDLIYGLPGQSRSGWAQTLKNAVNLHPEHISAYVLTWSDRTRLGRSIHQGTLPIPDENGVSDMFLFTHKILEAAGYEHYEISNYALSGFECRHNRQYWDGSPYLGLGPSAHSYAINRRWWNVSDIEDYISLLTAGHSPCENQEILSEADRHLERIALGLRTNNGIRLDVLANKEDEVRLLTEKGLAQMINDRLILTVTGMLLTDEIAMRLS